MQTIVDFITRHARARAGLGEGAGANQ
jgi:hypothetical protein